MRPRKHLASLLAHGGIPECQLLFLVIIVVAAFLRKSVNDSRSGWPEAAGGLQGARQEPPTVQPRPLGADILMEDSDGSTGDRGTGL